jgi:hypothetical protein
MLPNIVRVENVYGFSSEKSRKVELHLRVLIKTLMEEIHKIQLKTGLALEIDEAVVAMIQTEIADLVNVEDILKMFRPVQKIQ